MGMLVEGGWQDISYQQEKHDGQFIRDPSVLRNWITTDGSAGPTGEGGFKAESDRYHLFIALACPWAHRTFIYRKLMGLEQHVGLSIVKPEMMENGWQLDKDSLIEPFTKMDYLYQVYQKSDPKYTGRVTVPVLWDKKTQQIVNNESADIILMFNSAFNEVSGNTRNLRPEDMSSEIEEINKFIYDKVNNGVYKCGFAKTQAAYEEAFHELFAALDELDARLAHRDFLLGSILTEPDIRLFTTLVRFDAVYVGHFKCNKKRIADYKYLSQHVKRVYEHSNICDTVDFAAIKRHYYFSHKDINPTQIVPLGPTPPLGK